MTSGAPLDEKFTWEQLLNRVRDRFPKLKNSLFFEKWFNNNKKNGWLFDPLLVGRSFQIYEDMINKDKDHFTLIVGGEGTGKSTLSIQLGSWVDPDFCNENICFTASEYVTRLKSVKKGSCLVLDEAGVMMFSRESMSTQSKEMAKLFMLQRQQNISVIVCCPSFYNIDSYIRSHRISTLIRIIKQGHYQGYLPTSIKIINNLQAQKKNLSSIRVPNGTWWHGCFRKKFPESIDLNDYLLRKKQHYEAYRDSLDTKGFDYMPVNALAKRLSLNRDQVMYMIKTGKIEAKKIAEKWFVSKEVADKLLNK